MYRYLRLPKLRSRKKAMTPPPGEQAHHSWNDRPEFFSYTRGRFVRNEQHEMSQRYVRFNMDELANVAAKSVGSERCVRVEKFADGMFNKTFLLTMQDGKEVVGKVPNPNAGRPFYTTASEVATMDFARNVLGSPVPKVLHWSSTTSENPVGAEYVIMEKVPGVALDKIWPRMSIEDRFTITKAVSRLQKSWMSLAMNQYGSLYFSRDIEGSKACHYVKRDGTRVQDSRYTIGPSTGRDFFDDGRSAFNFDRGPWETPEEYAMAIGRRELTCACDAARFPLSPISLRGRGTYLPSRAVKIAALEHYLKLVPYLLPTDPSILAPYLWHSDLHSENIFVNPENPSETLGIIDWQSTQILPLYEVARQPFFLDYEGAPVTGLEMPEFPENLDQLEPTERQKCHTLYLNKALSALYRNLVHKTNGALYQAMKYRETTSFTMLLLAQNLFVDGEALYRSYVVELQREWESLPEIQARGIPPYPFHFSEEDLNAIDQDAAAAIQGMKKMEDLKTELGDLWPEKGLVRHDQYKDVKIALASAKERFLDTTRAPWETDQEKWDFLWPFDDLDSESNSTPSSKSASCISAVLELRSPLAKYDEIVGRAAES